MKRETPELRYSVIPLFASIWLIVIVGFIPSYYAKLPRAPYPWPVHWHAIFLNLWFGWAIMQAFLIRTGHRLCHRALGWTAVALAVLIVVSTIRVIAWSVQHTLLSGDSSRAISTAWGWLVAIILFGGFFGGGIFYRRDLPRHVRCLVVATAGLMPPGLIRFFERSNWVTGSSATYLASVSILGLLLVLMIKDRQAKRPMLVYPTGFALYSATIVSGPWIQSSSWWQNWCLKLFA